MIKRRDVLKLAVAGAAASVAATRTAWAQSYPRKPITLVVGFTPGGAGDFAARSWADFATKKLGQPVIVENRAGASGALAAAHVARSPADGYTLFLPSDGNTTIPAANPASRLQYDPMKDFEPVSQLVSFPFVLVVNPGVPAKSLREFVEIAKAKPNGLTYASWGMGSTGHLAMEVFCEQAGIKMTHVAYKGSAAAVTDLRAGHVQAMFDTITSARPHIEAGALRALGVSSGRRFEALPDIPTLVEQGMSDYVLEAYVGIMAPAGTPSQVVEALAAVSAEYAADPATRERLAASGMVAVGGNPAAFRDKLISDTRRYKKVIQDQGIQF